LGNDFVVGGLGSDILYGDLGDDKLYGDEGDDTLYGGLGLDFVYGGVGNDILYGDLGNDKLYGNVGDDILYGGLHGDILDGGLGNDQFIYKSLEESLSSNQSLDEEARTDEVIIDTIKSFETGIDKVVLDDSMLSLENLAITQLDTGNMWELTVTGTDFAVLFDTQININDVIIQDTNNVT
jgi:Ca2+-binding RTX toxin-like protein